MIFKTFRASLSFLSSDLKKKIIKLQFVYFFNSLAEFINVSLFYTFLSSVFQPNDKNFITIFFKEELNLSFNSFYGILFLVGFFFISNFCTVFLNYKIFYISEIISASLATNFFKKIISTKYETFSRYHPSEIIKKINIEIPILSTGIFQPLLIFFSKLIILIVFIVFILIAFDYRATLFLIFLFSFYISIFLFFKKIIFNYGKNISNFLSSINKILYESLNNFQIIKLLNKELFFVQLLKKKLINQAIVKSYGYLISQFPKSLIEFLIFSTMAFSFLWIGKQGSDALISFVPVLGTMAFIGYRVLPIGQQLYASLTTIKNSSYVLDSIQKNFQIFVPEKFNATGQKERHSSEKIFSLKLKNIFFRYYDSSVNILENFSCTFQKNNVYLIRSDSGKGKTTLINVIMGFLKPITGKIIINQEHIANNKNIIPYRQNIFFSPQFSFLFDATLYQNITLDFSSKNKANDALYFESLKKSKLYKDLKLYRLKPGKKIGHAGSALSGGQIQRVALARLFYNRRDVMIFDEPTNNLDNKNKNSILKEIKNLKKNRIVIILSHDTAVEKYCDQIINLN
jgi:ATP-binding cassette, subfamily B, bacterial PglK